MIDMNTHRVLWFQTAGVAEVLTRCSRGNVAPRGKYHKVLAGAVLDIPMSTRGREAKMVIRTLVVSGYRRNTAAPEVWPYTSIGRSGWLLGAKNGCWSCCHRSDVVNGLTRCHGWWWVPHYLYMQFVRCNERNAHCSSQGMEEAPSPVMRRAASGWPRFWLNRTPTHQLFVRGNDPETPIVWTIPCTHTSFTHFAGTHKHR